MERQKRLKERFAVALVVLFHIVGIAGFYIPAWRALFIYLVPYHLILMLMIVFYSYGRTSLRILLFFIIIYLLGYGSEWVGVHKNWLFGDYDYGPVLGRKLMGIPLLIGVNWFLLIFSTGALMQKAGVHGRLARIATGAILLVLLDILIEPVAMRFNYWDWANDKIPLKNYLCWFMLGVIMLWLFELFRFKRLSWAIPALLIMQFVFFGMLNLIR